MLAEDLKIAEERFDLKCGQMYKGINAKNRMFCDMLISIVDDTLIFKTRKGEHFFHKVSELKYLVPYIPRSEPIHNTPSKKVE